jgi:FAD synthase
MHVIRDPLQSSDLPRGGVATIGNFDGVHLGHRRILETVVTRARETHKPSIAITFDPHPIAVLRPDQAPPRLQTLRQKEEEIESLGVEWLLVIPFTRDFSLTEPEDFAGTSSGAGSAFPRSSSARTSPSAGASAAISPCSSGSRASAVSRRRASPK